MKRTYIWKDGRMVEAVPNRSSHFHHVIGDEMPPTEHPCDGKVYDSKSTFRKVTRFFGCEEVGNDLLSKQQRKPVDTFPYKEMRQFIKEKING